MKPIFYVAVGGSKSISDVDYVANRLSAKLAKKRNTHDICFLISDESGVPWTVQKYAKDQGLMIKYYPTMWQELGSRAPIDRNKQILLEAQHVIVFWDGENSNGLQLAKMAKEAEMSLSVFRVDKV